MQGCCQFRWNILDEVNGWVTVGSTVPTGGSGTDSHYRRCKTRRSLWRLSTNQAASIEAYVESVMLNKIEGLTEDYDNLEDGFNAVWPMLF